MRLKVSPLLHDTLFSPCGMPAAWAMCSANVFFFFSGRTFHPLISGSTGVIFTKFLSYVKAFGRKLLIRPFSDRSRDVAMAMYFRVKISESACRFQNILEYHNSDF